jgi:transposase
VSKKQRLFTREFKVAALARFERTDNVRALAKELGVSREVLYRWWWKHLEAGATGLSSAGRRRRMAEGALQEVEPAAERIAELERKVGQQQLELDFFRAALRQVKGRRQGNDEPGGPASTR